MGKMSYQGRYDLPETKERKEQKAVQVYGLLSKNPLIDPHRLTGYLLRALHGAEFDDMMLQPEQARQMAASAAAKAGGGPGMSPGSPMSAQQYQQMLPQLRAIQGGGGQVPQRG